ncbi:sulfatase [Puteibacter caeruleilacunae]|nr:sulfatase [Puteibacter caeruleilacunae]
MLKQVKQAVLLTGMVGMTLGVQAQKASKPNVIYIFPDQYRNYSMGFWSQGDNAKHLQGNPDPVSTPRIDQLASEGVVFSRAVSNFPLCSPYRGMLLSGMYPNQNGIYSNCRNDRTDQLKKDANCITDVFSDAGYHVGYFGKCHWEKNDPLFTEDGTYVGTTDAPGGNYINRYDTYVPPGASRHSIDYFFQTLKDEHFNPRVYSNDPKAVRGKKDGELDLPKRFSAQLESEKIIDYLANSHGQRDEDKPFFVMWALNPPHNPWTEESTYMEFFDQYTENGKANLNKLLSHKNADHKAGDYAPYYFANVSAVDHFIGKVLDELKKQGLDDNTIIVFSSDHGEMLGSHGLQGKNYPEIESLSVPFIIHWKGHLEHRIDDLILSVPDVMPTLLGLAGLEKDIPEEVEGVNYASIVENPKSKEVERPKSALYISPNGRGVYTGDYMFVVTQKEGKKINAFFYDNKKDPEQLNKIPASKMKLEKAMKKELAALLKQTNDRWFVNKVCDDYLKYE